MSDGREERDELFTRLVDAAVSLVDVAHGSASICVALGAAGDCDSPSLVVVARALDDAAHDAERVLLEVLHSDA